MLAEPTLRRALPWVWTEAGVRVDRERDGSRERLWVSPMLPDLAERPALPLLVEILCWFADTASLNEGLGVIRASFSHDTALVAVRRTDDATRLTLYTRAREAEVHDRYFAIRGALRPTAIGLHVSADAGWRAFHALLDHHSPLASQG
jgi:hypothetical protein